MDIISHSLSGAAVGTVAMSFAKKPGQKLFLFFTGLFAGALPDFDAISYWTKFDSTIGSWFGFEQSGYQIYHSKLWYGHHGAMHSFCFGGVFAVLLGLLQRQFIHSTLKVSFGLYFITFFLGYSAHLFEDMPTPNFAWGGVRLLFPFEQYYGGFGKIWWWNNYDLFLIILVVIVINLKLHLLNIWIKMRIRVITPIVFSLGVFCFIYQIHQRPQSFNYSGFEEHHIVWHKNEQASKDYQKQVLGKWLYQKMEWLDNQIPLWF
jgi:membrane-bound metal-dependent hydrolase YbcI (DUF457 family)